MGKQNDDSNKDKKIEELKKRLEEDVRIPDGWKVTGYTLLMRLIKEEKYAITETTNCNELELIEFIAYDTWKTSKLLGRSVDDVLKLVKDLMEQFQDEIKEI